MKTLIITPVHNAGEMVEKMCRAIDEHSFYDYTHILVDDNSLDINWRKPLYVNERRRVVKIFSDYGDREHKNQLGQAVQLGWNYGMQKYVNEQENTISQVEQPRVFLIESDVIVKKDWDIKMITESKKLGNTWATLDCMSVDEVGKLTYPTLLNQSLINDGEQFQSVGYADFQCTLINGRLLDIIKLSDIPSHFDILWSRKITQELNLLHYRTKRVEVIHYPHSSRKIYMS